MTAVALLAFGPGCVCATPRARDLGVPFEGHTGPLNAITDVSGVEVGHVTLIRGDGARHVGEGPVRTGVTVVLPRGRVHAGNQDTVYGGYFNMNGNGELTGQAYLQDFGVIYGPIGLSNTNAIGQVYTGIQQWTQRQFGEAADPVVAETWDGRLNDIDGFHVEPQHAIAAIEAARAGEVPEGNVGGGTGMVCFGFKGGIGTASRLVTVGSTRYTVGVLVQCNTGDRQTLRIAGAPVGQELADKWLPCYVDSVAPKATESRCAGSAAGSPPMRDQGSIIIVVATDAPLIPLQLQRLARRAVLGLGRMGSYAGNSSGDLVASFTTAGTANYPDAQQVTPIQQIPSLEIDPLFKGTVEATEEAITNALVASETMTGADGLRVYGMPHEALRHILRGYGRLEAAANTRERDNRKTP